MHSYECSVNTYLIVFYICIALPILICLFAFCFQDGVSFAQQVNKAIPTICCLLGSRTNSDVLEGIQFFVTAFEFGVQNALMGVRKMLLLIWSKQNGIKEAVVNAYKRLYLNPKGQKERFGLSFSFFISYPMTLV